MQFPAGPTNPLMLTREACEKAVKLYPAGAERHRLGFFKVDPRVATALNSACPHRHNRNGKGEGHGTSAIRIHRLMRCAGFPADEKSGVRVLLFLLKRSIIMVSI